MTDYWAKYYELRRLIEAGKSRNYDLLDKYLSLAKIQGSIVSHNWAALGIGN
ncbi:MAG: hypothetical protein NTV58_16120 [Deltaproteobacteria bacterium]|nr:hypothetical protein [Deltaproteobacteria bacterium]